MQLSRPRPQPLRPRLEAPWQHAWPQDCEVWWSLVVAAWKDVGSSVDGLLSVLAEEYSKSGVWTWVATFNLHGRTAAAVVSSSRLLVQFTPELQKKRCQFCDVNRQERCGRHCTKRHSPLHWTHQPTWKRPMCQFLSLPSLVYGLILLFFYGLVTSRNDAGFLPRDDSSLARWHSAVACWLGVCHVRVLCLNGYKNGHGMRILRTFQMLLFWMTLSDL